MKNSIIEHRLTAVEQNVKWLIKLNWVILGGLISNIIIQIMS